MKLVLVLLAVISGGNAMAVESITIHGDLHMVGSNPDTAAETFTGIVDYADGREVLTTISFRIEPTIQGGAMTQGQYEAISRCSAMKRTHIAELEVIPTASSFVVEVLSVKCVKDTEGNRSLWNTVISN